MLIPSIDLMAGRIVQLVQGERLALACDDFDQWAQRFAQYPLVQLIDLDAALGAGRNNVRNTALVARFCGSLPCQVGGGLRSADAVRDVFALGAQRAIIGSALVREGAVDVTLARQLAEEFGPERLVFAVDSRAGRVAIAGWRQSTGLAAADMMRALEPHCAAFLYTHIDSEGLMQGFPLEVARELRAVTERQLIVAGGIASEDEVVALEQIGADAVVGMAIYTGAIKT